MRSLQVSIAPVLSLFVLPISPGQTKAAQDEKYLGGFSSSSMRKGIAAGYGIYVTSKRIFGVYDRLASPGPQFGILVRRPSGHQFEKLLATKGTVAMIQELERRSDLAINIEEIASVEMKSPGWLRRGSVTIRTFAGKKTRLWIVDQRDFERAKSLLQSFCPSHLTVI